MPELHCRQLRMLPPGVKEIKKICAIKNFPTYLQSEMKIANTYNSWWHTI